MSTPLHLRGQTWTKLALVIASGAAALGISASRAQGAAALWISAPNWSYSAAAAESPVGWAYFWGLSVGPGTYSFAYAFSNDGAGDAAYAFAEAAVAQGGMGAVQVGGVADPYALDSIDITPIDPSNPGDYPTSKPGTDPFSSSYTTTNTGITFNGSGSELSGDDELQAFVYNGQTDMAGLESHLGVSSDGGTTLSGDVTDFSTLASDFGLIPLDDPIIDPSSITSLNFTKNTGDIDGNVDNVLLVGLSDAAVPEPTSLALLGIGGLFAMRRRRAAT